MKAELRNVDGEPVLRFERVFPHPPARVWRAVSDPERLRQWFPAAVTIDGDAMAFTLPGSTTAGEVLELDPPRVFAFRWDTEVLRFEVGPHAEGSLLVFTNVIDNEPAAGRTAAGWDSCLDALAARLDGAVAVPPEDWLAPMETYVHRFGLDAGAVVDGEVRFTRDLVWKPLDTVWALFTGGAEGLPTRAWNAVVPPGPVVEAGPPALAFDSPTGRVRWTFRHDPRRGTAVDLAHAVVDPAFVPRALAAWHAHLDLFFAATFGVERPWPAERVADLVERYRASSAIR
ncbi:SRPBCC family protein [Actinosynnema sp. NPDC020468]|uniref:SRPBCC family protein n=1 Tax=Actinosynnema sp. NPDC020468 TaxID=3154488 RepID=UPI0033CAE662